MGMLYSIGLCDNFHFCGKCNTSNFYNLYMLLFFTGYKSYCMVNDEDKYINVIGPTKSAAKLESSKY